MGLTAVGILEDIKAELNYNPQFDNDVIIPLINKAIRRIANKSDIAKEIMRLPITNADVYDYTVTNSKVFRIINVWYGQEDISTLQQIKEGFIKLSRMDRASLGKGNSQGYWLEPTTYNNIPYHQKIKLTFQPTVDYYLVIEFTTWEEIPTAAFTTTDDLNLYVPEEIHDLILEWVVARLKLRDRDQTAGVHLREYRQDESEVADVHQERITHLDVDD